MRVYKDTEPWAIDNQRSFVKDALHIAGEKVLVRQRWHLDDYLQDKVERCPTCHAGQTQSIQERVSSAYGGQAGYSFCEDCYGIGYEGGFKPEVYIVYADIAYAAETWERDETGEEFVQQLRATFSYVPLLRQGDLIVRAFEWNGDKIEKEEGRFTTGEVEYQKLRTGPRQNNAGLKDMVIGQSTQLTTVPHDHAFQKIEIE